MTGSPSEKVLMLADLIREAAAGKKVTVTPRFINETIQVRRDGSLIDTNVLSVEYTGKVGHKPFKIKKSYLFSEDVVRHPLECLLIANNRLQMDYARLKKAKIAVPEKFFTLENVQIHPSPKNQSWTSYRLQDFIILSRSGIPVTVSVNLKFPELILKQGDQEKRGFACAAEFVFQTVQGKNKVEKVYGIGSFEDPEVYQNEVKNVASKRLERDCDRLRRAGMEVGTYRF